MTTSVSEQLAGRKKTEAKASKRKKISKGHINSQNTGKPECAVYDREFTEQDSCILVSSIAQSSKADACHTSHVVSKKCREDGWLCLAAARSVTNSTVGETPHRSRRHPSRDNGRCLWISPDNAIGKMSGNNRCLASDATSTRLNTAADMSLAQSVSASDRSSKKLKEVVVKSRGKGHISLIEKQPGKRMVSLSAVSVVSKETVETEVEAKSAKLSHTVREHDSQKDDMACRPQQRSCDGISLAVARPVQNHSPVPSVFSDGVDSNSVESVVDCATKQCFRKTSKSQSDIRSHSVGHLKDILAGSSRILSTADDERPVSGRNCVSVDLILL